MQETQAQDCRTRANLWSSRVRSQKKPIRWFPRITWQPYFDLQLEKGFNWANYAVNNLSRWLIWRAQHWVSSHWRRWSFQLRFMPWLLSLLTAGKPQDFVRKMDHKSCQTHTEILPISQDNGMGWHVQELVSDWYDAAQGKEPTLIITPCNLTMHLVILRL